MQHEGVARRELAGDLLPLVEEAQLGQLLAAAVAPDVEPEVVWGVRLVGAGHDQAVGLRRAVDLRAVAAHDQPRGGGPRRPAVAEVVGPVKPLLEQFPGDGDLVAAVELVVFQGVADGVVEDLHVRQQPRDPPLLELACQHHCAAVDLHPQQRVDDRDRDLVPKRRGTLGVAEQHQDGHDQDPP